MIYAHTTSRTPPTLDKNVRPLILATSKAGGFVELTLLHLRRLSSFKNSLAFPSDFLALVSGLFYLGFPKTNCLVCFLRLNEALFVGFPSMININQTRQTSLP
jgi:hypothetical protein